MRDKIARKMAHELASKIGSKFSSEHRNSEYVYLVGGDDKIWAMGWDIRKLRDRIIAVEAERGSFVSMAADVEQLKSQMAAVNQALRDMAEAAKPTCKTCGQKIGAPESGKRTGGK